MAAADDFTIAVTGRGGHAALPHQTVDPVLAASAIVLALQRWFRATSIRSARRWSR